MLLTTNDVAKKLDCSADNVRKLEREGKIPAQKTPTGRRIFNSADVEKLALERTQARERKQTARAA